MDVYLVRHGQTDGNRARRHQHPNTGLNEVGKEQASAVAKELDRLKPTHLITSTHRRALETARIIGAECGLVPETYPPFEELRRPQFHVGTRVLGGTTLWYIIRWFFGVEAAAMHDGETYQSFLVRLQAARQHLEALPPNARVVIVSHNIFINFFRAHLCRERPMSLVQAAFHFCLILLFKNSGVLHIRYDTKKQSGCRWRVVRL